jgi:small-conductance mechanosensitive channel
MFNSWYWQCLFPGLLALVSAIAGGGAGVFIGARCSQWFRLSPTQGSGGPVVLWMGISGAVLGIIVGIISARIVEGWLEPSVPKALALSVGITIGVGLFALALFWIFVELRSGN